MKPSTLRLLLRDTRGDATTGTFGFAITWFTTFFVFLMNVQLGQLAYRRDAVDHSAAVAADTAKKTYCMTEENKGATEAAAEKSIRNVMQTVGGDNACKLTVTPRGNETDPGAKRLAVKISCSFPCKIPVAAQFMCSDGQSKFESELETVSMGCDGKGGG